MKDSSDVTSNVSVPVAGGLIFQSVSAGAGHNCGITTNGAAYCWGQDSIGKLGQGTIRQSNVPVAVVGGLRFQTVSAGARRSCGVTTEGKVYCWGEIWKYLEDAPPGIKLYVIHSTTKPMAISSEFLFKSVSVGGYSFGKSNVCGLTKTGAAFCWGTSANGDIPVQVARDLSFKSVSAGVRHSCGVTTEGAAYCWGGNKFGKLGNGKTIKSNVPVAVLGGHEF